MNVQELHISRTSCVRTEYPDYFGTLRGPMACRRPLFHGEVIVARAAIATDGIFKARCVCEMAGFRLNVVGTLPALKMWPEPARCPSREMGARSATK